MPVFRVYVEKKPPYAVEARALLGELRSLLGLQGLRDLRILNRYDVEGIDRALFDRCVTTVFSEPPLDDLLFALPAGADAIFAVESLPGQFDQRADSASECIQLISAAERPAVRTARVYLLTGELDDAAVQAVKKYVINPVDSREASLDERDTLRQSYARPAAVETLTGFTGLDRDGIAGLVERYGLAMDAQDAAFCQQYFRQERRDPTMTELRMIDTYWSDHCRHTTFGTVLDGVQIDNPLVERAYRRYQGMRAELYGAGSGRPVTLMDLATIGAKYLKKHGVLKNLDESDEINACSVRVEVDVDGKPEDWLLLFKNETHNHPTEIEPFGGAATCIGGAIRDPLANRGYVYQAMRVTGAGDPLVPVSETIEGKLPQRKLVTTAAAGYASYGNQIGLATGIVDELYHPGYVAKRMEIGAVVGAVPERSVRREAPAPGDLVILLGGRTGRDGIGGATGSSKAHRLESLETCGAQVQKGNAPVERKLQRLFRDPQAVRMIKRCNDFGAGGVSVAIGELAPGLQIDLDAVPKKYDGLDGTELAISESQERMAVVVEAAQADAFIACANRENLEATVVARVTGDRRLVMDWNGQRVCDISRDFLDSNGAEKHAAVTVGQDSAAVRQSAGTLVQRLNAMVGDLNICDKKGLGERFDSTIGAATVLMPYGGAHQMTPIQAMAAKFPVEGETNTCSGMAWGFNPYIAQHSEYRGAYLAVVESVAKLVASGFEKGRAYLTFQEYFKRLGADPARWGSPFAALLGALSAQADLGVAAIGGKDSMSGSFEKIDVPPTLVSFAVAAGDARRVISPEFKAAGHRVVWLRPEYTDPLLPEPESLLRSFALVEGGIASGAILSAYAVGTGGAAEALFKMALGNRIGFEARTPLPLDGLFGYSYGSFLLELADGAEVPGTGEEIGRTTAAYAFAINGEFVPLDGPQRIYESRLEPVFPRHGGEGETAETLSYRAKTVASPAVRLGEVRPRVLIPVLPGTNCELDSARAMRRAGAQASVFIVNNLTPDAVAQSVRALAQEIDRSQMVFLPGGFSGGDEPEGSAKLIAAVFRAPAIAEAVTRLLEARDGLMLGICNGFQALIKLGLLPFGRITETDAGCPTLTFNTIGRHQSMLVRTRVASDLSPWFAGAAVGEIHTVPVSHGEGRFVADDETLARLSENGQIATQYVDLLGRPSMDLRYNPNGSVLAVEGITSPDGRVLGKMAHSERIGASLYKNVPGEYDQKIFQSGVAYFK